MTEGRLVLERLETGEKKSRKRYLRVLRQGGDKYFAKTKLNKKSKITVTWKQYCIKQILI